MAFNNSVEDLVSEAERGHIEGEVVLEGERGISKNVNALENAFFVFLVLYLGEIEVVYSLLYQREILHANAPIAPIV